MRINDVTIKILSGETELSEKVLKELGFQTLENIKEAVDMLHQKGYYRGLEIEQFPEFLAASLSVEDYNTKEKALLNLYYLQQRFGDSQLKDLLKNICDKPQDEKSELTRGRMYWIKLSYLVEEEQDSSLESIVRSLKDKEQSEYVWERIFGILGVWKRAGRLYPEICSWNIYKESTGPNFGSFRYNVKKYYKENITIGKDLEDMIPKWIYQVLDEKVSTGEIEWILETLGVNQKDFPLSTEIFNDLYNSGDGTKRALLTSLFGTYQQYAGWERSNPWREILKSSLKREKDMYEELNSLLLTAYDYFDSKSLSNPFNSILQFLLTDRTSEFNTSAVYESVYSVLSPILLTIISNRSELKPNTIDIVKLLEHKSPFYVKLAVDISLVMVRSGYNISNLIPQLERVYSAYPNSKSPLGEGKDIQSKEFEIHRNFTSHKAFVDIYKKDSDNSSFSLNSLTTLLSSCQSVDISFRSKLALQLYKSQDESQKVSNNKVTENNYTISHKRGYIYGTNDLPIGIQVGPLTLNDIKTIFDKLNEISDEEIIRDTLLNEVDKLKNIYELEVSEYRQSVIKSIFDENVKTEKNSPFASIYNKLEYGGGREFIIPKVTYPENTMDYLAYYRPEWSLEEDKKHHSGIYFNGRRMLDTIKSLKLSDSKLLTEVVGIHELFHAHIDLLRDSSDPQHWHSGESPSWCRLEEAAANYVSREWLITLSHNDGVIIEKNLFKHLKDIKIPGYGEYDLLDKNTVKTIPSMLKIPGHTDVKQYKNYSKLILERTDREINLSELMWKELLTHRGGDIVPFYINCEI